MKTLARAGALPLCLAFGLAGCAQFDQLTTTLASPRTTQAVANLQAGSRALVCALSTVSAVAGRVEDAVSAGQALVGTTGKIYVASAIVCDALGGTVTGTGVVK